MDIQFKQNDMLTLSRMSFIAEKETGTRFKLSKIESVTEMLQKVALSKNNELKKLYNTLIDSLDQKSQETLIYRGVQIPPELRKKAAVEAEESANLAKIAKRVYRGQVLEEEVQPQKATTKNIAPDNTPTKSKRIYRGRVIED